MEITTVKVSRFKHAYRSNASKLHRKVGDILREGLIWGEYEIYQEYPVNKVNSFYPNGSHKFDWVIPKLKLVIECHGKQHYEVQTFGAKVEDAISSFHDQQSRDKQKKEAALECEWIYIEVPYTMENDINEIKLMEMYWVAKEETESYTSIHEMVQPNIIETFKQANKVRDKQKRQRYLSSELHQEQLAKARDRRRQEYRRLKKLNNGY